MPTLLLLHGWGGNADSFGVIKKYLARRYQVLAPTLPCPPAAVYTLADYVRDVQTYLQQHQVTQCDVIAHSFGARLVALLNVAQPQLFRKIVITGGAGLKPRFNLGVWWRIRWHKLATKLGWRTRGGSADYRVLDANGKKTFQNIIHTDLAPAIRQIRAPLLLINGHHDRAVPLSMVKRWRRLVPHAQIKLYHGDHFAYLTHAAQFIKDVTEFFDA